jgi:2-oxoisovalerate dehydrogenase E2 component (dihydrolipoyl transacylase)
MARYTYKLPDVGEGVAEAEIVAWHVKVGDHVEEDQPLVEVMTDKATVEMTAPVSGLVLSRNGEPGELVAVGSELAVLELEGADAPEAPAATDPAEAAPAVASEAPAPAPQTAPAASAPVGEGRFVYKLPDVGEGVAEAEIVAWHVKVGDHVEEDQPLVEVMTDKATVEMTAPVSGTVLSIKGAPGEMVAVGSILAELAVAGEAPAPDTAPVQAASPPTAEARAAVPASPERAAPAPAVRQAAGGKALASPAVRGRAKTLGVDLAAVAGGGPEGRVTHQDLDAFVGGRGDDAARPRTPAYARREGIEEVKVIGLRRKIAEKMQESKRRIPHFGYVEEVDVTELEDLRIHINATRHSDQPKLTLLPFLMRALVKVLPDYPQINARYDDDAGVLHRYAGVHIGIATATPNGLIVPVVRHAETLDLWQSASEVFRLARATREGRAARAELSGSTITITSLGPMGGIATLPVINHPETAIISPNKMVERPVVRNGQIVVRKIMNLSSCYDHRVVDGYDGAEFVQRVKALLEHPAMLFID